MMDGICYLELEMIGRIVASGKCVPRCKRARGAAWQLRVGSDLRFLSFSINSGFTYN